MSVQEDAALGKMRRFCASILKKLAPPLLREIESSSLARAVAETASPPPRRMTRAAASTPIMTPGARRSKKASVAETALLKALGIMPAEIEVNDDALQDFRDLCDSPVREQHLRAMAAIFGKTMPSSLGVMEKGPGSVLVQ
jgi:hypothetical protein